VIVLSAGWSIAFGMAAWLVLPFACVTSLWLLELAFTHYRSLYDWDQVERERQACVDLEEYLRGRVR
jgi:hypothetical protein